MEAVKIVVQILEEAMAEDMEAMAEEETAEEEEMEVEVEEIEKSFNSYIIYLNSIFLF